MANKKVQVDIVGDAKSYTKATNDAVKASQSMASKMRSSVMQGLGMGAGFGVFGLVTTGVGMMTDAIGDSISAASDQAEAMSKVTVVFGDQADEIAAWARTAATSMGMSETAALSAAGTLGNLFDALGLTDEATRDMSKGITQLAADLGSFNNVATDEALLALRSGLLGEAEPMRKFGSNLSAARVEAYALANGLAATKSAITEAVKVQARYALILEDTKNAQGDFARTSEGLANSTKTLNAQFADMQVQVGDTLQKAIMPFLRAMVDLTNQTPNVTTSVGKLTQGYRDLINAQEFVKEGSEEQGDIFADIYSIVAPLDKTIHDFTGTLAYHSKVLGVSRKELALFTEAGLTYGDSLETIKAKLNELVSADLAAALERHKVREQFGEMADAATAAGNAIYGGLVKPVKRALREMFQSMADALDPWKEQWRQMAAWAKDAFSEEKFGDYIAGRVKKAMRNARKSFGDERKRWLEVAEAYRYIAKNSWIDPMKGDLDALLRAIMAITRLNGRLGNFRRNGNGAGSGGGEGGNGDGDGSGGGPHNPPTGKNLSPLGFGGSGMGGVGFGSGSGRGGMTVNIYAGAGTDPAELGRVVTKALRAYGQSGGVPAMRSAIGA